MTEDDILDDDTGFPEKAEEMCTVDKDGNKTDMELHDEMLDNPIAEANFQLLVHREAIAAGMEPDLADRLYGNKVMADEPVETRWEELMDQPPPGFDNDGNLDIVGFDQKAADEWAAKKLSSKLKGVHRPKPIA